MGCAETLIHAAINIQLTNVALRLHLNSNHNNDKVQPIETLFVDANSKAPIMDAKANHIKRPIPNGCVHSTTKDYARSLTTIVRSSTIQRVGTTQMGGAREAGSASSFAGTIKALW